MKRGRQDEVGIYLEEIGRYPLLTEEEEKDLAQKIRIDDEKAKERFIKANLRLVVSVAKRYSWATRSYSVSFMDLISAGNEGLMRAVDKFDPNKGRFSTYAWYWIRQAISKFLMDEGRTIRMPVYRQEIMSKIIEARSDYYSEYGELPSREWLAEKLGIKPSLIAKLETEFQVISSLDTQASQEAESLEYFLKDDIAERKMEDTLSKALSERTLDKSLNPALERFFSGTSGRERKILALRTFRSKSEGSFNLRELGELFGITREAVRQIERKVISRFQAHIVLFGRKEQLRQFLAQGGSLARFLEKFQRQAGLVQEIAEIREILLNKSTRLGPLLVKEVSTPIILPVQKKDLVSELRSFLNSLGESGASDFLPQNQTVTEALDRLAVTLGLR